MINSSKVDALPNLLRLQLQDTVSINQKTSKEVLFRYSLSRLKGPLAEGSLVPMSADPVFTHFHPHYYQNH